MKRISQLNSSVEASALSALNFKSEVHNPPLTFKGFCSAFKVIPETNKKLAADLKILYDAVVKDKKGRLMVTVNGSIVTVITDDFVISKSLLKSLNKSHILWYDLEGSNLSKLKDIIGYNSQIILIQ